MSGLIFFEKIGVAYTLTNQDNILIAGATNWEDDTLKPFKERLIGHLASQQNLRCTYCRQPIKSMSYSTHLEHIVNKKPHPWATFLPNNLALACNDCNIRKQQQRKRVLTTSGVTAVNASNYPSNSNDYGLVHPYIDTFSQYIEIHKAWLFRAKVDSYGIPNPKGANHINMFDLDRLSRVEMLNRLARFRESTGVIGRLSTFIELGMRGETGWKQLAVELKAVKKSLRARQPVTIGEIAATVPPITLPP